MSHDIGKTNINKINKMI